jgi:hypothetical protein
MLRSKMRADIANDDVDPGKLSIADQFAEIMVHICLEYDLEPDVLGAAQDVLQALKARGKNESNRAGEVTLPAVVSRGDRSPWLFEPSDL